MNDEDRDRFTSNFHWFNSFFDGVYQFFNLVVQSLPADVLAVGFEPTAHNYYYARPSYAPAIPSYYALLLPLRKAALQVVAVFDERLFTTQSWLEPVPSIVVVLHDQPERHGYLDDYALRVIGNRGIDIDEVGADSFATGTIKAKSQVRFGACQIGFDKLSDAQAIRDSVQQDILGLAGRAFPGPETA